MSIKKTSILALSVLLSYESFAAPTVLATTPRLGASSSVASTGRGKATTSVSIGGGLNKLTSNRGQGSFTPNSAPTDKQNELIENFQKEIQNVRDAVAEELQYQNDKIKDLEETIKEKDEKIAELEESIEESIDEKIEKSGFITAESVRSEISTAKQEAVRQATKAAVADVNSMGFAKTAEIKSEISTAKNAAIEQAKTEAVAAVNSMGFAKTATIESDILNAKNAAIELAKNAALAEVESKGFATTESVQNLKAEITNERAADIASIKNEIQEDVNKLDSDIKNINIDGAIESKLASKGYATTTQLTENINAAKTEITNERDAALQLYAKSADVSSAVTTAKDAAIAAANTAIEAEAATRSAIVATLATREELDNLEVGVDQDQLTDIINEKLHAGDFATATALNELSEKVTQNTQNITEESGKIEELNTRLNKDFVTSTALTTYQGEVAGTIATLATRDELGDYAKSSALTSLDTRVTKNAQDITATQADVDDIGNTIAKQLLDDEDFKGGVLAGLSTELTELPGRVANLEKPEKLEELLGNRFVKPTELKDEDGKYIFVQPTEFEGMLTSSDKFKELDDNVKGFDGKFALNTALEDEITARETAISGLDSKFVPSKGLSSTIAELEDENGKIFVTRDTLGTGVVKLFNDKNDTSGLYEFASKAVTTDNFAAKLEDNKVVTDGNFTNKLTANPKFTDLDTKFVKSTELGTGVVKLFNDETDKSGLYEFASKAVTTDNFAAKLEDNKVVTDGNLETKLTKSTALDKKFVPSKDVKDEKGNYTFVTQTDVKKIPSAVITEMQNSKSEYYIGNWTDSTGKKKLLVTQNDIEDETSSLGSALKNVNSAVTKAQSTADTASTDATSALSAANTAQEAATTASNSASSALNKATSAQNMANAATTGIASLNTRVTNAETSLANNVVTKTSLSADLLAELTANTSSDQCSEPTGTTGDLINLLNSGTIGECGRNYTPAK